MKSFGNPVQKKLKRKHTNATSTDRSECDCADFAHEEIADSQVMDQGKSYFQF